MIHEDTSLVVYDGRGQIIVTTVVTPQSAVSRGRPSPKHLLRPNENLNANLIPQCSISCRVL